MIEGVQGGKFDLTISRVLPQKEVIISDGWAASRVMMAMTWEGLIVKRGGGPEIT